MSGSAGPETMEEVHRRLASAVATTLDTIVPAGAPCALIDFPNHPNVGDNAIWLGERAYLRRRGCRVVYACDVATYDAAHLRRRLPADGIVLIHGGGNFGDLWPAHQQLREQVVADVPDRRVVQMPQSVFFGSAEAASRARSALAGHESLMVCVRDRDSRDRVSSVLGSDALLVPDMAFMLPRRGRAARSQRLVALLRSDKERAASAPPVAEGAVDWVDVDRSFTARAARRTVRHLPRVAPGGSTSRAVWSAMTHLAARRLAAGRELLGSAELVVTDRLHGHILCLLYGVDHVVVDNSYGKLSSFMRTWGTDRVRGVSVAASAADALAMAIDPPPPVIDGPDGVA